VSVWHTRNAKFWLETRQIAQVPSAQNNAQKT
jgi:hypothetical protein